MINILTGFNNHILMTKAINLKAKDEQGEGLYLLQFMSNARTRMILLADHS